MAAFEADLGAKTDRADRELTMTKQRYFKLMWFLGITSFLLALPNVGLGLVAVTQGGWIIVMALVLNGFIYGLAILPFVRSQSRMSAAISCSLVLMIAIVPWLISQGELAMHKSYLNKQGVVPQVVERSGIKMITLIQHHRNPGCDRLCRTLLRTEQVRAVRMISSKGNFGTTDTNEQLFYKHLPKGTTPPGFVFSADLTIEVSSEDDEDLLERDPIFNTLALNPVGLVKTTVWRGEADRGEILANTLRYMYKRPMVPGLYFISLDGLITGGNDGGLIQQKVGAQTMIAANQDPAETLREMGLRVPKRNGRP